MCLGIPGRVLEVYQQDGLPMGKVQFGGIAKEVCLAYTPEAQVDEYVLVHVGFAISQLDEEEAAEIFSYLQQIGEAAEEEDAARSAAGPADTGPPDPGQPGAGETP
jgi:hydrogenase expression/formation protein HypC